MTDADAPRETPLARVLGERSTDPRGPLLLVTVALHGNEPGGIQATRRVLAALEAEDVPVRGRLRVLIGNLGALAVGERFNRRDLNRRWSEEGVAALAARRDSLEFEELEQWELAQEIDRAIAAATGPVHLLDMHSFSADGAPFVILGDTLRNRRLAFPLRAPVILGLEETVEGTLLEYLVEKGHVAVVVEGGRHDDPRTVDLLEASLWLALHTSGCVQASDIRKHLRRSKALLDDASKGIPRAVEVSHRQALQPDDGFVMGPGYTNLQHVEEGEVLASDREGSIASPRTGHILMPLYQKQGEDGFFLTRPVAMFWLHLSAVIRCLRLELIIVPLLPGVHRHPARARTLLVNPRIARWSVVEIFRLLGFRPNGEEGGGLLFTRRRDWAPRPQR